MPKLANLERGRQIRDYLRQKYVGREIDLPTIRSDLSSRFGVKKEKVYYWWKQLLRLNQIDQANQDQADEQGEAGCAEKGRPENGRLVQSPPEQDRAVDHLSLRIPANIDEATKLAINQLLQTNANLAQEANERQAELKSTHDLWIGSRRKIDLLKKILIQLLDQL